MPEQQSETHLPEPAALRRLAVNDSGFVFDPVSGRSFSVNETGRRLLKLLSEEGRDAESIVAALATEYDAPAAELQRDLNDFARLLNEQMR